MKKLIVSVALMAAFLSAPVLAGGQGCCADKASTTAEAGAACAKDGAQAKKGGDCCAKETSQAAPEKSAEKGSCCSGEQAKAPVKKACQTCESHSWMLSKPNADCKACQTASL